MSCKCWFSVVLCSSFNAKIPSNCTYIAAPLASVSLASDRLGQLCVPKALCSQGSMLPALGFWFRVRVDRGLGTQGPENMDFEPSSELVLKSLPVPSYFLLRL